MGVKIVVKNSKISKIGVKKAKNFGVKKLIQKKI